MAALDWNPEATALAAQRSSGRSTQGAAIRRGGVGVAGVPLCPFVLPVVPGPGCTGTAEGCGHGKARARPDVRPSSMLFGSCCCFPNLQRQPGGAPPGSEGSPDGLWAHSSTHKARTRLLCRMNVHSRGGVWEATRRGPPAQIPLWAGGGQGCRAARLLSRTACPPPSLPAWHQTSRGPWGR